MQMAIDEAILISRIKGLVPNTLRFFSWEPSAVTIGFFQSLKQEVDISAAKKNGVDIIRRYTGGGAVFHEHELTYSLAISENDAPKGIIESYQYICSGIVESLKLIGLEAEFKPINDIIVNGKKISGSAQTRKNGIILQHGTIIIDVDVEKMFSLLKVPDEKIKDKMIASVKDRVTSLNNELKPNLNQSELEKTFEQGFSTALDTELISEDLTPEEIKTAEKLHKEKYNTKEWNYWR